MHGDFRGGLNTKAAAYLLEPTQCRDCRNVQSTTTGAIVKRPGVRQITLTGSWAGEPVTLHSAESLNDNLVIATADNVYGVNVGTSTISSLFSCSNGFWSVVETTSEDSQGPVFMSNGVNTPKYWNGTSTGDWTIDTSGSPSSLTVLPNGKYLTLHESRVVSACTSDDPSSIYWSDVQVGVGTLPRVWPIENQQLFDPDDGETITALGKTGSNLLVFKDHKVFAVYDLATGANRRLTTSVGCVASRSVVETPMGTLFLSDQGVYSTNGTGVDLVSDAITPTIASITSPELCTAALFKNHYYLVSPADGLIFDFDLILKSWWVHTISGNIADIAATNLAAGPTLYGITRTRSLGALFEPGYYTDFGSSYEWYWKGPWVTPGQARAVYPAVRKRLRAVRVDGGGHVSLGVSKDFYDTSTLVTSQAPDGTPVDELFPESDATVFGPNTESRTGQTVTYFGDFDSSTDPDTLTGPTTFGDVSVISQARVWGQGVARAWAFNFSNALADSTDPRACIIDNYTIFTQERNQ